MKMKRILTISMTEEEYKNYLNGNVTGFIFNFSCDKSHNISLGNEDLINKIGDTVQFISGELKSKNKSKNYVNNQSGFRR